MDEGVIKSPGNHVFWSNCYWHCTSVTSRQYGLLNSSLNILRLYHIDSHIHPSIQQTFVGAVLVGTQRAVFRHLRWATTPSGMSWCGKISDRKGKFCVSSGVCVCVFALMPMVFQKWWRDSLLLLVSRDPILDSARW